MFLYALSCGSFAELCVSLREITVFKPNYPPKVESLASGASSTGGTKYNLKFNYMKVIEYGRVSTDKQTLEQQNRTVKEWLSRNDLKADIVVTEEGISGGVTYKKRKLGTEVLPLLETGDMLIVAEISRLGRSMGDINKLINDELKPRKIRLVIVQMNLDLNCGNMKAIDEMILYAFSFGAAVERELIQERTRSALAVKNKR